MPIFFVAFGSLALLCVGLGMLAFRSTRPLSGHLVLGAILGLVCSFILSTGPFFLIDAVPESLLMSDGWPALLRAAYAMSLLLGYLLLLPLGWLLGFILGSHLAKRLNNRLGWNATLPGGVQDAWGIVTTVWEQLTPLRRRFNT